MSKLTDLEDNDFFTELTPEEAADLKGGFGWGDLWKDAWGVYGATAGGVAGFVLGAPLSPVGQAATSGAGAAVSQYTREAISQSSTASGAVIVRYRGLRTLGDWARSRNALPAELATHRAIGTLKERGVKITQQAIKISSNFRVILNYQAEDF